MDTTAQTAQKTIPVSDAPEIDGPSSDWVSWHVILRHGPEYEVDIVLRDDQSTLASVYHGEDIMLGKVAASIADLGPVVSDLRAGGSQTAMMRIIAGHTVEWDGSNQCGSLTPEAAQIVSGFRESFALLDRDGTHCWDAWTWFAEESWKDIRDTGGRRHDSVTDELVDAVLANAASQRAILDRDDVRDVLEREYLNWEGDEDESEGDQEATPPSTWIPDLDLDWAAIQAERPEVADYDLDGVVADLLAAARRDGIKLDRAELADAVRASHRQWEIERAWASARAWAER